MRVYVFLDTCRSISTFGLGASSLAPETKSGSTDFETACPKPVINQCESTVGPGFEEPGITLERRLTMWIGGDALAGANLVMAKSSFSLPLIRTLGKAFCWQRIIDTGEVANASELAGDPG